MYLFGVNNFNHGINIPHPVRVCPPVPNNPQDTVTDVKRQEGRAVARLQCRDERAKPHVGDVTQAKPRGKRNSACPGSMLQTENAHRRCAVKAATYVAIMQTFSCRYSTAHLRCALRGLIIIAPGTRDCAYPGVLLTSRLRRGGSATPPEWSALYLTATLRVVLLTRMR